VIYRVSHVEAFRKWEGDEEAEEADLIDSIRGLRDPTEAMLAGTALHKALEAAGEDEFEVLEALGFRFRFRGDYTLALPVVRELRASKVYLVDGEPITISGQVDALEGKRIDDHKSTSRFDPDRYITGYQWRLYLDIFGADVFRWNVFEMTQVDSTGESEGFELPPPEYEVFGHHTLEQHRYPQLEGDCQRMVERFARFVHERVEVVA
jgi:hypothetical protein